jgi:hypothetical protein
MMAATITACFQFCAAAYFWKGLGFFKDNLRVSYRYLSFGLVMLGLSVFQHVIYGIFNADSLNRSGVAVLPYVLAAYLIFLGARHFSKELHIISRWFSLPLFSLVGISVAVVVAMLPYATSSLVVWPNCTLEHQWASLLFLASLFLQPRGVSRGALAPATAIA